MTIEKRFQTMELRAKGRRLEGYAALFGTEARIGGGMVETIASGAFKSTLEERAYILALVDHDPARVLARTRSGTRAASRSSSAGWQNSTPKSLPLRSSALRRLRVGRRRWIGR